MNDIEEIYIGGFIIRRMDEEGKFWISDVGTGEGMQTNEEKLAKMIADFWAKEF